MPFVCVVYFGLHAVFVCVVYFGLHAAFVCVICFGLHVAFACVVYFGLHVAFVCLCNLFRLARGICPYILYIDLHVERLLLCVM